MTSLSPARSWPRYVFLFPITIATRFPAVSYMYKIKRQLDAIKKEKEMNLNSLKILPILRVVNKKRLLIIMFSNQQNEQLVLFFAVFSLKLSSVTC